MPDLDAVAEAIRRAYGRPGTFQAKEFFDGMAQAAIDALRPTVSTVEQLDALPDRCVVLDADHNTWRKNGRYMPEMAWMAIGDECECPTTDVSLPALVLWRPEAVDRG